MSMNGIDISGWQSGINLAAVPCDFVIIKSTQGTSYVNKDCDRAYQQAKKAGKLLGVYHYFSGGDPVAEADFYLKNIAGYLNEAILVLDWEGNENAKFNQGPAVAKNYQWTRYRKWLGYSVLHSTKWRYAVWNCSKIRNNIPANCTAQWH